MTPQAPALARSANETALELPPLPAGYRLAHGERGVLATAEWAAALLERAGFGPDGGETLAPSALRGRKPLQEIPGTDLVVRRYTHGGLLRGLTGNRFRDGARPFRELALAAWLESRGFGTPPVAAARARAVRCSGIPCGYELDLVTRRVEGAHDLEALLSRARQGEPVRREIARAARAFGRIVGELHRAGFLHADLTTKNVLCDASRPEARLWLLDLDRSRLVPRASDAERRDNLRRLWRFVERGERRRGRALHRSDVARFLAAYEPDRERRRADLRAVASDHARLRAWHALGGAFESLYAALGRYAGRARG